MNPLPLEQIRLDLRSHRSALGWLGLLYRRPTALRAAEAELSRLQQLATLLRLYLHAAPYLILLCVLGRFFLFGVLGLEPESPFAGTLAEHAFGLAFGLAVGLTVGLAVGLALGLTVGLTVGLALGLAFGLAVGLAEGLAGGLAEGLAIGLALGLAVGLALGLAFGLAFGLALGLAFGLALGLAGGLAFGLALGLTLGLAFGLAVGLGFALAWTLAYPRLYYIPLHVLLVWPRPRPSLYRFHPAAWDDCCLVPLPGLDRLLVAYAETDRAAQSEIDRLIDQVPGQRGMALRAQAILIARDATQTKELARLDEMLVGLPEGKKGFLAETRRLRELVHDIAAAQARLDTLQAPALREPYAALLVGNIKDFEQRIAGFAPPLSTEFRAAARAWLRIARRQLEQARERLEHEKTPQIFRAGDPVDPEKEAFVPRYQVLHELERQVMLGTGCPGIVLYGRRRLGKSTMLRNLSAFLPPSVHVASLSMQKAEAFTDLPSFLHAIAGKIPVAALPHRDVLGGKYDEVVVGHPILPSTLHAFEETLNHANDFFENDSARLVLAIDEYEGLDLKIGEGVFPLDLLAVIRESIQSHRNIIWIFAGSRRIDELGNAPWTSYLVSTRTLTMPMFGEEETRLLLTEPLRHSSLWQAEDPARPSFAPGFWGEGGIERLHAEAGGWPHLVQLAAENVVDLLNDAGHDQADAELLERAFDRAVDHGTTVFRLLLEDESTPADWQYLRGFRRHEEQPPPADETVERSLRRRELIAEEGERWRLRVPLMARWMRING